MTAHLNVSLEFNLGNDTLEDLSVSKLPEGHGEHDERNVLDDIKSEHGHRFIETGRFSVVIADKKSLVEVKDEEGEASDSVKGWHGASIAESDADLEKNSGVTIMDKVLGTSVKIDVGLNGGRLCHESV